MGSMQKVMQKLRAKSELIEGLGRDTVVDELAYAPETPAVVQLEEQAGEFVFDGEPRSAPVESVVDNRTIEWESKKLDNTLVTYHERYSAISEQYRSLRARLLNMNPQSHHQMIAITSSLPQEGKSVTTLNLGMVMAEGDEQKVLIIDADFRRASVARMLGISPSPGFSELIRGECQLSEVLRPTHIPNLKIMAAGGPSEKKYGELLGTSAVGNILTRVRQHFDYVIMDTPPVNTVSDVSMLVPHCDGVLLVIEMRRTPEPSVQEAVRTLQTTNVKILGCILSQFNERRGNYYERYYSYYYNNTD